MKHPAIVVPAVLAAALGCGLPEPWPQVGVGAGIVAGVVRDTSGRPLSGLAVDATAKWLSGDVPSYSTDNSTTGSDGSYLIRLSSTEASDIRASLGVAVGAPFGSPLHDVDTTKGLSVLLTQTLPPAETSFVNIIMR